MFVQTDRNNKRTKRGSALIVGMLAVFLVVTGCVVSVLLLINTGVATFNKEKVGYVAFQAANYAATYVAYLSDQNKRQTNVTEMVNGLLTDMGLRSSNTTVVITDTTLHGQPAVSVSVTATLPTITAGSFSNMMPSQVQSSYTQVKVKAPYATQYIVGIDPFGGKVLGGQINPIGLLPNDGAPAWAIAITGVTRLR